MIKRIKDLKDLKSIHTNDKRKYKMGEKAFACTTNPLFFIAKKEAQQHIYENQNHYNNTVHTYAMTAWRSRVVEKLWDILRTADFNSLKEGK